MAERYVLVKVAQNFFPKVTYNLLYSFAICLLYRITKEQRIPLPLNDEIYHAWKLC